MAWVELEFCRIDDTTMSAEEGDFIDEAFFQLNVWRPVVEMWFAARNDNGNSLIRHFDGRSKTRVRIERDLRGWDGEPCLGRLAMLDFVGPGRILLDRAFVELCRDIHSGAVTSYLQSKAFRRFGMADRYWALLETSAIILHELNHVVWRTGEVHATCMEGFFRFNVQSQLGINTFSLCGQASWPCNACTSDAGDCGNPNALLNAISDVSDWPAVVRVMRLSNPAFPTW